MNPERFEKNVINIPRLIEKCYSSDPQKSSNPVVSQGLYFPRFKDEELKDCLRKNSL